MKILIISDVHLCCQNWYGVTSADRMDKMVDDLNRAYELEKYEAILFLGDYSLDHWMYQGGGSYLNDNISNANNFIKEYLPRLKCQKCYLIPGNHEQYGDKKWLEMTGMHRQFSTVISNTLFLMLDNFSENLDPDFHSDGTYTSPDMEFIRSEMEKYPNLPVVLCAHYFDTKKDAEEFKTFVRENSRVLCLFCGHDHGCQVEEYENKKLFHDGNYSYAAGEILNCMWGWREVYLQESSLTTNYFMPKTQLCVDGRMISCDNSRKSETVIPIG